ncbi:22696_t:CDS:1, partial [Gigaspora rosea]
HKTQSETRQSTKDEAREYIRTRWISEDFFSSYLKSAKTSQPYTLINPKFTFIKKFLERRQQRLITLSLPSQTIQSTPIDNSEIPIHYITLLESEIFNKGSSNSTSEQWKEFGLWANFSKVPNFNKRFRLHCRHLWSNVIHAHKEAQKKIQGEYNISETFSRSSKNKLDKANEITKNIAIGNKFEGYYHVFEPQCFKNSFGETVVDFFVLRNLKVIEDSRMIVSQYYNHNLDNKKHQSKEFKKELVEHF